jgi:hypothetical protein
MSREENKRRNNKKKKIQKMKNELDVQYTGQEGKEWVQHIQTGGH